MNFQQAGFEIPAQEYERAALAEIHVAAAQATDMSRAYMRGVMGVLENEVEQTWTSRQVALLNGINSFAGDVLENQIRSLLDEAAAELQMHERQSHEHLQQYQQGDKQSKTNWLREEKKQTF